MADIACRMAGSLTMVFLLGALVAMCNPPGVRAATPPTIEGESATVTASDAVLEAQINPQNDEGGAYYQFQVAPSAAEFWPEVTCPAAPPEGPEIPCLGPYGTVGGPPPAADITRRPGDLPTVRLNGGTQAQSVSLDLAAAGVNLLPGTTYHYRVLAVESPQTTDTIAWEAPPTYGEDLTFTTDTSEVVIDPPFAFGGPSPQPLPPLAQPVPVPPTQPRHRCHRPLHQRRAAESLQHRHKAHHSSSRCRRGSSPR